MLFINHLRAHVFHHSSAALKINKPELAKAIVSVKQSKLQHAAYLKKDLDSQTIAKKERKYDSVLKQCEAKIKENTLVQKIKNEPLTSETAEEVLDILLDKLKNNDKFTQTDGIFRKSGAKDAFDKTSLVSVIKNTEELIEKYNDGYLVANKIKQELLSITIDRDASNVLITLSQRYNDTKQIPSPDELPSSLNKFILFLKESIITNKEYNNMDARALSNTLSMVTTQDLPINPLTSPKLVKSMAPMYEALLSN